MFSLPHLRLMPLAVASACVALVAAAGPAAAQQPQLNLGPVGPNEPILVTFGDKRMIAYYEPNGGNCFVSAVVSDASPMGGDDATRVRVALHPGELFDLDNVEDHHVVLLCGFKGEMLTVLNRDEVISQAASDLVQ